MKGWRKRRAEAEKRRQEVAYYYKLLGSPTFRAIIDAYTTQGVTFAPISKELAVAVDGVERGPFYVKFQLDESGLLEIVFREPRAGERGSRRSPPLAVSKKKPAAKTKAGKKAKPKR